MVKQQIWVQALLKVSKSNREIWLTEQLSIITPPMWHGQSFYLLRKRNNKMFFFSFSFFFPWKNKKGQNNKKTVLRTQNNNLHILTNTKKNTIFRNQNNISYLLTNTNKNTVFICACKQQNKPTKQCFISLNKQFLCVLEYNKYNKSRFHNPLKTKQENNVIILWKTNKKTMS